MAKESTPRLLNSIAHPWHGVSFGPDAPSIVKAFIEIVPTDTVKYEVDKETGLLRLDRPQRYSSLCPSLYGFIPQTYCGKGVGAFCSEKSGRPNIQGDGDPIDICVVTEKQILHGNLLVEAVPLGGLRILDKNQADDKIIAALKGDWLAQRCQDIGDLPEAIVDRLMHYFLTYKDIPGTESPKMEVLATYGAAEAREVISRSSSDYKLEILGEK